MADTDFDFDDDIDLSAASIFRSFIASVEELGTAMWLLISILVLSVLFRGSEFDYPAPVCDESAESFISISVPGTSSHTHTHTQSLESSYYEVQASSAPSYEWVGHGTANAREGAVKFAVQGLVPSRFLCLVEIYLQAVRWYRIQVSLPLLQSRSPGQVFGLQ